jgi:hypothetical protein
MAAWVRPVPIRAVPAMKMGMVLRHMVLLFVAFTRSTPYSISLYELPESAGRQLAALPARCGSTDQAEQAE